MNSKSTMYACSDKKFCHGFVIIQDVEKVFQIVKEKIKAGQLTQNNSELKKLWHNVTHSDNSIIANCSSEVIMKLVNDKSISIDTALKTLVSLTSTLKNPKWSICLAFKLLKLHFVETSEICKYCKHMYNKSPYQLHFHTHPLIFILNSFPSSWNSIITEIQMLCYETKKHNYDFISISMNNIVELVQPFFVYVFLNPSIEEDALSRKVTLFLTLLNAISPDNNQFKNSAYNHSSVIFFSLDMLCSMNISEIQLQLCNIFFSAIKKSSNLINNSTLKTKFSFAVLVGYYSFSHLPISNAFACLLLELLKTGTSISEVGVFTLCLANLICQSHPDALPYLLECAIEILQSSGWLEYSNDVFLTSIFSIKASILQLLLNKHLLGFNNHLSILHKTLTLIDQAAASSNIKDWPDEEVTELLIVVHNLWILDSKLVFHNLLMFKKKKTLSGFLCLIKLSENIALNIKLVVCGLFLSDVLVDNLGDKMYINLLNLLSQLALVYPSLSMAILPTILYSLKNTKNSFKQKTLLLKLPEFVTDNNCIAPILGAIQSLSQVSSLLPTALQLMVKLWKKQERCFPYLHKMIIQMLPLCSYSNKEITTIITLALKDLCAYKSFQNFSELLAMILTLLKKQLHPGQVVFLLNGIYSILDQQLVNIQSVWDELLKNISCSYTHDSVTIVILKILSLVPKFEVENPKFLKFKIDILKWICHHLESSSTDVKGAVLVSLAHFKRDDLINMYLPSNLQPQQLQETEELLNEELLSFPISGENFVNILHFVPMPIQAKYFCSALLNQELQDMPRDIKDRAFHAQKQSSQLKAFSELSTYVVKFHDKNKQPNLKASFAASVLMCYNPSLEESQKVLVSLGRDAMHLLQSLLGEVIVDGKNWKGLLWVLHAWKNFMKTCFKVMVKGRIAELNMQLQQKNSDKEEIDHKLLTVSFWCRDKINELLKNTSKGTPTMQGNSFLALSGLFCALYANKTAKEDRNHFEAENCGYLSNDHWLGMASDTIISAADSNYKSVGRIFSWCQYKSVSQTGRLTTSKLGEVCALQAVKMMLPALVLFDMDRIKNILSLLHNRVKDILNPNVAVDQHISPVVSIHLHIVSGSLTAYLYEKKMNESSDDFLRKTLKSLANTLIDHAANLLNYNMKNFEEEEYSSDDDSEETLTSYLGIAELLPVLFRLSNSDLKDKAVSIFISMTKCLEKLEEQSGKYLEAFYFSFVSACIAGKETKVLNEKTSASILTKLKDIYLDNKNIPSTLALSHFCCMLKEIGDEQATILYKDLFSQFLQQVSNQRLPTCQKLSSLNGLVALFGSESIFLGRLSKVAEKTETDLKIVVKLLKDFVQQNKDSAITSNSIMLLGHMYLSLQSSSLQQVSTMPKSYSYLPKSSILKEMFKALELVEHNDSFQSNTTAKVILHSIAEVSTNSVKTLPPVNWEGILSKIIQFKLDKNEQMSCIKIGLSQCLVNNTAAAFVTKCIVPSLFKILHMSSQSILLQSLHIIIQSSPSSNVVSFFSFVQSLFYDFPKLTLQQGFLVGIQQSLQLPNLNEKIADSIFLFLKSTFEKMNFSLSDNQLTDQWKKVTKCIAEYPDVNHFLIDSNKDHLTRILFVKCELLMLGHKSLQWLDQILQICSQSENESFQMNSLYIIFKCLRKLCSSPDQKKDVEVWMQELLGTLLKSSADQYSNGFFLRVLVISMMSLCKFHLTGKKKEYFLSVKFFRTRKLGLKN